MLLFYSEDLSRAEEGLNIITVDSLIRFDFFVDGTRKVFGLKKSKPSPSSILEVTTEVVARNSISSGYLCEVEAGGSDSERYRSIIQPYLIKMIF